MLLLFLLLLLLAAQRVLYALCGCVGSPFSQLAATATVNVHHNINKKKNEIKALNTNKALSCNAKALQLAICTTNMPARTALPPVSNDKWPTHKHIYARTLSLPLSSRLRSLSAHQRTKRDLADVRVLVYRSV